MIKKRRYWRREVHRDIIIEYSSSKTFILWSVLVFNGMRNFFMKEPDYNIILILKYSGLIVPGGQKE